MGRMDEQGPAENHDDLPADESLGWALHHLAVSAAQVDVKIGERIGLSASEYLAMKHLLATDSSIGPVELGNLLGISSGSATALVDRLEKAGHLLRIRHPNDRRRLILRPTESSVAAILNELQPLGESLELLARDFTPEERTVIHRFLKRAANAHRLFGRPTVKKPAG